MPAVPPETCRCPSSRTTRRDGPLTGPPPTSPIWLSPSFGAGMGTPSSTCSEGGLCWPSGAHTRTSSEGLLLVMTPPGRALPSPGWWCWLGFGDTTSRLGRLSLGSLRTYTVPLPVSPSPPPSHPQATTALSPSVPTVLPGQLEEDLISKTPGPWFLSSRQP